jgi:hypothetical protein
MHKTITAALAAASLLALGACQKQMTANDSAASGNASASASGDAISGTWKADLTSVKWDSRPDKYLLAGGQYSCETCTPPYSVAADGSFHPVAGQPYFDSESIKIVDQHSVESARKKGDRDVGGATMAVSADGNTLAIDYKDSSTPNAPPTTGHYEATRVAPAPAGAHAISGSWKPSKIANLNQEALTTTYKLDGDMLHMTSPSGVSYDAKVGGPEVPIKGDPAGTTVAVAKAGDNGYQETDKRGGKVVSVATFSVGTDSKLNVEFDNKQDGSKISYVATKS